MSLSAQCPFLWVAADAQHHIVPFLACCHRGLLAFAFTPTVSCRKNEAVKKHALIPTDVCTLHHHTYRLPVSHDCILKTIRAKCDLLQHRCVSHSVIPHLSLSSSTPASAHNLHLHSFCLLLLLLPPVQLFSLCGLFCPLLSSSKHSAVWFLLLF